MKKHDDAMELFDQAMKQLDEQISGLVGEFMRRANP
jgi:hypothetical protein